MDEAGLAIFAGRHHGIFRTADALGFGFTPSAIGRRTASGEWVRMHYGALRHAASPETWKGRLLAACWAGGERAVASHRSGAALHTLPGGRRDLEEITCPRWRRAQHETLVVHETKAYRSEHITMVDGIPCSTVERVMVELGAVRGYRTVLLAFDAAVKKNLTTWHRTAAAVEQLARPGRNGLGAIRWALAQRSPEVAGPESPQESMLLIAMRDRGLPDPVPQYEIHDRHGLLIARVEGAYPKVRISFDYDSHEYHSSPAELDHDNDRRNRIMAEGWIHVIARHRDLARGGHQFFRTLTAALEQRQPLASITTAER